MTEWIGYLAGIITAACNLPQLLKILRTRKVGDISLNTYLMLFLGLSLWVTYGILDENWPVTLANGVSLILVSMILVSRILLGKKPEVEGL